MRSIATRRLLVGVEHLRQLLDGGEDRGEVEDEGEQRADLERPALHEGGARPQHEDGGHGRQQLDEREVRSGDERGVDAGPTRCWPATSRNPAMLRSSRANAWATRTPEMLSWQVGVDGGDAVADLAVGPGAAPPEHDRGDHQRRHDGQHHQRQPAFIEARMTMTPTNVTSCTMASMRPVCSSDWSASMSEVMRVMMRPAISRS